MFFIWIKTTLQSGVEEGDIDHNIWGELESESEESSEEEEDDENEDIDTPIDESGLVTPAEGMVTPSGLTSVTAGMETPDTIELRKKKIESEMEEWVFHLVFILYVLARAGFKYFD